jgi:UDP-N-acetylmuramate dehydrogenase
VPRFVLGGGYNILVRDGGVRGAVISLERFTRIEMIDPVKRVLRAGAGAENLAVVRFGQERGLGGIGFIAGIPGTVGGAMMMNAGAYGSGILERTRSLTLLRNGTIADYLVDELDYGYRRLTLLPGDIILAALFSLEERDPAETEEEIRKDLELRRMKHAVGHPSAGSFFKNPPGQTAWRLIDQAGLRGKRIGGAQVSEVHSNFLINRGRATANDFLELAALVKERVKAVTGVELEEEVRIVGEA